MQTIRLLTCFCSLSGTLLLAPREAAGQQTPVLSEAAAAATPAGPRAPIDQPCDQIRIDTNPSILQLSEEEASRLLIHKVAVKYPGAAKAAHISGSVILQATISKEGEISNIRPLCGPKILQEACMNAVKKWKYRPYILNGKPIELNTTITSVFRLGDNK